MASFENIIGKLKLWGKRNGPTIFTVGGVIGLVGGGIYACVQTYRKLPKVIDEHKDKMDTLHQLKIDEDYTEQDLKKDTTKVYLRTGMNLAKIYGPSVIVGGLSVASILVSHRAMKNHSLALGAAYAAADTGFKEYRKRVAEKFGDAVDEEMLYGLKDDEIEETETDDKGKEKKVKRNVKIVDNERKPCSPYAKFFDESSPYWEKDADYNKMFVLQVEAAANRKLNRFGHLFLNEVYDELGLPRTKAGQTIGWIRDEENPEKISFGLRNIHNPGVRDFINGYERTVLLDFNVDGDIISILNS